MVEVIDGHNGSLYTMRPHDSAPQVIAHEGPSRQWSGSGPVSPFEAADEERRRHYAGIEQCHAQNETQQIGRLAWDVTALMDTMGTNSDTSPDGRPLPF